MSSPSNLGDFSGEETPVDDLTFGWFGAELRVHPELCDTSYVDWMEEFGDLDKNDPKAALGVKRFMQVVVHPDDFEQYWALGKKHRRTQEQHFEVAHKLIDAITDRPTEQSSDSSAGLSATAENSMDASYERVIQELEGEGRPDLALVYVEAQEAGVTARRDRRAS